MTRHHSVPVLPVVVAIVAAIGTDCPVLGFDNLRSGTWPRTFPNCSPSFRRYPILDVPHPSDVVGVAKKGAVQHGPKASFGSVETGVR